MDAQQPQPTDPPAPAGRPLPLAPHPAQSEPYFLEQIAEMQMRLEAMKALPGLNAFRQTAELPQAFFDHMNAFLAGFDRITDYILGYSGDDKQIKCTKGCSNCCIDLVRGISTPEIINIYHHVRLWADAKQLFEYHRDSAEQFMEILLPMVNPGEPPPQGDDDRVEQAHKSYNLKNRPCGFLDQETGCCRIYAVRPIACRYFFSVDPPETCTPTHPKYFSRDTRTVHLPPELHVLLREVGRQFGFITLNYLSGAFCAFAAEVMKIRPIKVVPDDEWATRHAAAGE